MDINPESRNVFSEVCSFYSQILKNLMFLEWAHPILVAFNKKNMMQICFIIIYDDFKMSRRDIKKSHGGTSQV